MHMDLDVFAAEVGNPVSSSQDTNSNWVLSKVGNIGVKRSPNCNHFLSRERLLIATTRAPLMEHGNEVGSSA